MPIAALADLVAALRQHELLEPAQLQELPALQARFPEPRSLARELIQRGWLTPYQVNHLCQGRLAELFLGSYLLLERVGAGGMGQVFKARHRKLGRIVALKVIRKERLANRDAVRRFQREIRAAAQLNHPNIVHAFDAEEEAGTHFLVMEYVEGSDLSNVVHQQGPLPIGQACDCIRQAALGLQHAHERGLVHRDIKPSNLLLSRDGVVKVLDVGLARLSPGVAAEVSTVLTHQGLLMGTPDFLAPEQALDARQADIRSDLYSLGCTSYFLLTGRPPFPEGTPLQKVVQHQVGEPEPLEKLRPEVPPAVRALVRRLMARRPEDRYQTPAEVAHALAALDGLEAPVSPVAPPPSLPPADPFGDLLAGDTVEAADSTGVVERQTAERRLVLWTLLGGGVVLALTGLFVLYLLRPAPTPPPPPPQATLILQSEVINAQVLVKRGDQEVAVLGFPEDSQVRLEAGTYTLQLAGNPEGIHLTSNQVTLTPGGRELVRVTGDPIDTLGPWSLVGRPPPIQGVRRWTLTTRSGRGYVQALAFDPQGRWLATANQDGVIRLLDAGKGFLIRALIGHTATVKSLAWSPDGETLASVDSGQTVRLWQGNSGKALAVLPLQASGIAWSADGHTLACVAAPGLVLWDVQAGKVERRLTCPGAGSLVSWSPDGKLLAVSAGPDVRLFQADTGEPGPSLVGHTSALRALSWSPDSQRLAAAGSDRSIRLWDVSQGQEVCQWKSAEGVNTLAWSPDGKTLAGGGAVLVDGKSTPVYLWDAVSGQQRGRLDGVQWALIAVAWAPDGRTLAGGGDNRGVYLWEPETGTVRWSIGGHTNVGGPLAWSADGKLLASASVNAGVTFWDPGSGKRLGQGLTSWKDWVSSLAWSPDGQTVAAGRQDFLISLVEVPGGRESRVLRGHTGRVSALAWSLDGKQLASGSEDRSVRRWPLGSDRDPEVLGQHAGRVICLAWSPDGQTLASGGEDSEVYLWGGPEGPPRHLDAHARRVRALAWSPDGQMLAWGGGKEVHLWEAATGTHRQLEGHEGEVTALAWESDGRTLLSLAEDATVRVWDVAAGSSQAPVSVQMGGGVLSPDGRWLARSNGAYTAAFWETATGRRTGTLLALNGSDVVVGAEGHFRETPATAAQMVYVVETDQGQDLLLPAAFEKKYGWHNDPQRASLLPAQR